MSVWQWLGVGLMATLVVYAAFVACLLLAGRRRDARAIAGFIPDCIVLTHRLIRDPRVPRSRKAILAALIAYLAGRPPWFETAKAKARSRPEGSELETFAAANADRLRLGGIVVAVLLLIVIGIGWFSIIVLGILLALLLWGVATAERRAREREAGDAPAAAGGTD